MLDSNTNRFFEHVGPSRDALANLVEVAVCMRLAHGFVPAPGSNAMTELSQEASFAGAWGADPVRQAHSAAALMLLAAEDYITSVIELLQDVPLPSFSHLVLARAALEACGRAQWLCEVGIGAHRRIARGMTERIYSLAQQERLPRDVGDPARPTSRRQTILEEAARQGFALVTNRRTPTTLEERRPGATEIVKHALGDGADPDLGRVLFGYFSAVSHSTAYGLLQNIHIPQQATTVHTPTFGQLETDSSGVNSAVCAMTLAYVEAVERHRLLFGWQDDDWAMGVIQALTSVRQAFPG